MFFSMCTFQQTSIPPARRNPAASATATDSSSSSPVLLCSKRLNPKGSPAAACMRKTMSLFRSDFGVPLTGPTMVMLTKQAQQMSAGTKSPSFTPSHGCMLISNRD